MLVKTDFFVFYFQVLLMLIKSSCIVLVKGGFEHALFSEIEMQQS